MKKTQNIVNFRIYRITFLPTGQKYVGSESGKKLFNRWKNKHSKKRGNSSIAKLLNNGADLKDFKVEIIYSGVGTSANQFYVEQLFLDILPLNSKGYFFDTSKVFNRSLSATGSNNKKAAIIEWKFANPEFANFPDSRILSLICGNKEAQILCFKKTGEFVNQFTSTHEIQRQLKISQANVCSSLNGKSYRSVGNYVFVYADKNLWPLNFVSVTGRIFNFSPQVPENWKTFAL